MRVAVFSTKSYDKSFFSQANAEYGHELKYFEPRLTSATLPLAKGFPCICVFVNDVLDGQTLRTLASDGLQLVALRCAGFNNVDLQTANALGIRVVRVPAYSPHAVAEHSVALMLSLSRQLHRAYTRVRDANFALEGLLGFDFHSKTVGIIGTGKIGETLCRIMRGFGCNVLAHDVTVNPKCLEMGVQYVELDELYSRSDIISLHCPLTPSTRHLINEEAINQMKDGVMLINTSRGAIVDTAALVAALKSEKIRALGLDVYEEEAGLFFEDQSNEVIQDDIFARLLTFPNVLITGHQAFFTQEAMSEIATKTLLNIQLVESNQESESEVFAT
ncbi:MAG: 2-hydroxyacid dehydrogenase [Pirellulaceae bacterium]